MTARQRELVELLAAGYTETEVAGRLGISVRTVKAHCDAVRRELGVKTRREIPRTLLALGVDTYPRFAA